MTEQDNICNACIAQKKANGTYNPTDPTMCLDCAHKISPLWHKILRHNMSDEERKAEAKLARWNKIFDLLGLN